MRKIKTLILLCVAAMSLPLAAQVPALPIDPSVRYGRLDNGLTYYIRHNERPAQRANFYIAQKVGAVQEEENQRGLAHFLEHMCFNGTDHFPGDALTKYCESIGVKFGVNLNAYTSTDETVYNIDDVPVTGGNVDSCLLILRDWSDGLTLAADEIDKERGVIHEEWRLRSSASMRIYERNLPVLYPESRYGHRFPIGLMSVVDNFRPQELRDYYAKWYRPDLQGIIVVGDIDVDAVETKIKDLFGSIRMPENAAAYETYPVPDNATPIYVIDKDKEQSRAIIQLMFKSDALPEVLRGTMIFLAENYMDALICDALNSRLDEISKQADCPFIGASTDVDNYLISKTKSAFSVGILPKPGHDEAALQAVMEEVERARRYGFTDGEILRARDKFLSRIETVYDNRDKQENSYYVPQYVRHFLDGDAIPDIATEYNTYKALSQQLPTQVFSEAMAHYTARIDTNFVCLALYPDKEDVVVPTAEQLHHAVEAARSARLEAYVDNVKDEPLIATLPKAGKIKKEEAADFGYTCWTLSNGARVFYKVTDFNDSEILVEATSFGGKSLTTPADRVNAELLGNVCRYTGLGNFSSTELEKKLAGKQASLHPWLGEATEGLNGQSTPKDLRTLFELLYLHFQQPANDEAGYNNFLSFLRTALENADKVPMQAFSDSVTATLYGHNALRPGNIHLADLDRASYDRIRALYSERFAAAGDFDFYFTGAINVDSLRAFTQQYIASLPAVKKRESYVDRHIDFATGVVDNHFVRAMETPQAVLIQQWSGSQPYSVKADATVNALAEILTQRYLKSIREDAGVAYSVGADGDCRYGRREEYVLDIQCPFKPAARDSVLLLMRQAIDDIAAHGVTDEELDKVRKYELKTYADNQRQNSYWQNRIQSRVMWGKDSSEDFEAIAGSITSDDIRAFVNDVLLRQNNCITISMVPADFTE